MSSTLTSDLTRLLRDWSGQIEELLVEGCEAELLKHRSEWSDFEVASGFEELHRLRDRDLAYDRPSIGVHYAYWYHLRRVHELVRLLGPRFLGEDKALTVVDLGAGTGATAWAMMLLSAAAITLGVPWPRAHVVEVDASPYMLDAAETLWERLSQSPLAAHAPTTASFILGNWANDETRLPDADGRHLVVASYLFDASDAERMNDLAQRFTLVCRKRGYRQAVLTSAAPKGRLVSAFAGAVESDWTVSRASLAPPIWSGNARRLSESRGDLLASVDRSSRPPSWTNEDPAVIALEIAENRLFRLPHATLVYDSDQEVAAEPADRMTVITGAAGSGKSRVISERVVRVVERAEPARPPVVLVTAFNKPMVDQLAHWIDDRMGTSADVPQHESSRQEEGCWEIRAENGRGATSTVVLMNRDKLPTRLLGVPGVDPVLRDGLFGPDPALEARVRERHSSEFLEAEFERVLLANAPLKREEYVSSGFRRHGRGTPLQTHLRGDVWDYLMASPPDLWAHRRMCAVNNHATYILNNRRIPTDPKFTHVFIDECQDFTAAELRLLARVPPSPHSLCIAGDETQSIHLGASYRRPGISGAQWAEHELAGSYRLPARVCEAVRPLAEAVEADHRTKESGTDGAIPEIRKSAAIGPRPVVIAGNHPADQVAKTIQRLQRHVPNDDLLTVVRGRSPITKTRFGEPMTQLEGAGFEIEVVSMLRIKGLERGFVIFPSDDVSTDEESTLEWVYTSLTRATGVVVIVVFDDTPSDTAKALSLLPEEHLLLWDQAAVDAFRSLKAP